MAGLLSLPNELLLSMCLATPTLQTAARVLGVSRKLHSIRTDKDNEIIYVVLSSYLGTSARRSYRPCYS